MTNYVTDYIRLCYECSQEPSNVLNMLSIVIPTLQKKAARLREAVDGVPVVYLCRQLLAEDAEKLEAAIAAGLQRCQREPVQQELFAA